MSVAPTKKKPSELRLALLGLLLPLYVAVGFSTFYIGGLHAPAPHQVKVAIVGPSAKVAPLARGISVRAKGGFNVSQLSRVAVARRLVAQRKLAGAYVPAHTPSPTIVVASAASPALASFLESAFRPIAAAKGQLLAVDDVRPLPAGDSAGTASFFFLIICTITAFLTVAVLGAVAPTLAERTRLRLFATVAVGAPAVAYLIGGAGFGAYGGSFGTISAMIAMGALYAFTVVLISRGLQLAFGTLGALVGSLIFVFMNFPSSGGSIPAELLPGFWRFLHHFWIGAPAVDANRSILYFGGAGVGTDALKILAWLAVAVVVLALPILRASRHDHEDMEVTALEPLRV